MWCLKAAANAAPSCEPNPRGSIPPLRKATYRAICRTFLLWPLTSTTTKWQLLFFKSKLKLHLILIMFPGGIHIARRPAPNTTHELIRFYMIAEVIKYSEKRPLPLIYTSRMYYDFQTLAVIVVHSFCKCDSVNVHHYVLFWSWRSVSI